MSDTFRRIVDLVRRGELRISAHGYDEMAEDGILASDVIDGVAGAVVVEDYPAYPKGPCTLVLRGTQADAPFTRSGVSREGRHRRPCLLLPIDRTRSVD